MNIADVRQKFPQYNDLSDADLASALHRKFYADMPRAEFDAKIGLRPVTPKAQTDDPGMLGAAAIAGGRTFDRMAAGLKDMMPGPIQRAGDWVGSKLGMADSSMLADRATQDKNTEIYNRLAAERPLSTAIGGALPLVAGLPAAGTVSGAALVSALPGLVSYGTPQEKLTEAALGAAGGALGAGAGQLVGRALNPIRSVPDAVTKEAAEAAARVGYRPTVGQETGNRALQMLEQQAAKNPIAARSAQNYNQANTQAINRAAARGMGESADQITEDVFAAARSRIGAEFDRLSADRIIPIGKDFSVRIQALQKKVDAAGPFKNTQAADVLENAALVAKSGRVTGEVYQAIRSELTDMSRAAARAGNDKLAGSIKGVRKAFDDAAEKAMSEADMAAWKTARQQYAVMKALEKRGAVKAGDVDPAIVRNNLQSSSNSAFARGMSGELADIARIGNAFRPLPDSGTAGNLAAQVLLSGGAGLMGPGALAASLLGPAAASKVLFSGAGQKYLRDGAVKVTPELEKKLIQAGYGLLGLPSLGAAQ